jgi:predicted nucleic acid-binding protein
MDRLFLDANVLFSAAHRPGRRLSQLWALDDAELLTSEYAVEEARRNLKTPEKRERLDRIVRDLQVVSLIRADLPAAASVLPAKDQPILAAAIQCGATHLLTGDLGHFGPLLGQYSEGVLILTPGQYLDDHQSKSS